ncbi:type II toxin-antitoxin system HicA family toxin [Candidatus Micrarchaeota archaeon]|nr:type II toxin-antitoxin system HicA family toxin [Candidatus Micrarchaeota archaeon]MBU2476266.1 type II toxin-antitoxin system HicA family toxin [Candidatus Micrarchaeota archaeon]
MPKTVSGLKLVKFLKKKGFEIYSRKGSHVKMISIERNTKTIIPMHKEIAVGTLNSILKQAELSEEEIKELLE